MNGFENKDKEATLKRDIEALLSRKRIEFFSGQAASQNTDPAIDLKRENQRLQRLLAELLLKNQQLRSELAGREPNPGYKLL